MKKFFAAAFLCLPLVASQAQALNFGIIPCRIFPTHKYTLRITPYNAFTPFVSGNIQAQGAYCLYGQCHPFACPPGGCVPGMYPYGGYGEGGIIDGGHVDGGHVSQGSVISDTPVNTQQPAPATQPTTQQAIPVQPIGYYPYYPYYHPMYAYPWAYGQPGVGR
jgi:hypothetical protein